MQMPVVNFLEYVGSKTLVTLALFIISYDVAADQWIYREFLDPGQIIRIETNPNAITVGGRIGEAKFCSPEIDYICIQADGFEFFFPRRFNASTKSWTVNGSVYTVSGIHSVSYFGTQHEVIVVLKAESEGSISYVYSQQNGLLAFGGKGLRTSATFLLDSTCGFGAPPKCEKTKKSKKGDAH